LARADDTAVWEHARTHGLAIVTKDQYCPVIEIC
jgi:predicted nuclease of predicted toxin-antitoxin system